MPLGVFRLASEATSMPSKFSTRNEGYELCVIFVHHSGWFLSQLSVYRLC
jgi:hypothetical protein